MLELKDETIYVAPESITNKNVEYIKLLSGKIDLKKPSFASSDEIIDTLKEFDSEKPRKH